jgi:hypothetical protein
MWSLAGCTDTAQTSCDHWRVVGERGDSWHTFHVIIFHIFSVLVKLNVTARMVSNTLGLQSNLHKFDAIHKELEGEAFALTSARVPTCPTDGVSWHMVKYVENQDANFSRPKSNRRWLICFMEQTCQTGAHPKGGYQAAAPPNTPKLKFKKHRFCRYDDINGLRDLPCSQNQPLKSGDD